MSALDEEIVLVPGGPCSCSSERYVRWAIGSMPGLPLGEVSCRPIGDAGLDLDATRKHDMPARGVAAVRMPGVAA
jgi:hypothetical protein